MTARILGVGELDVDRVVNSPAASIPLVLRRVERDQRPAPGDAVALAAFGAGFVRGGGLADLGGAPRPTLTISATQEADDA